MKGRLTIMETFQYDADAVKAVAAHPEDVDI